MIQNSGDSYQTALSAIPNLVLVNHNSDRLFFGSKLRGKFYELKSSFVIIFKGTMAWIGINAKLYLGHKDDMKIK